MSVVAFLVLGRDGSSSVFGSSAGLTTSVDRSSFLQARRAFSAILIGGRTAANESYAQTPAPLIVVSRTRPSVMDTNPQAQWWNISPSAALDRAIDDFGTDICIEGGVNFLNELLSQGKIDELRLSVTPFIGGDGRINIADLLAQFRSISTSQCEETQFYICVDPVLRGAPRNP